MGVSRVSSILEMTGAEAQLRPPLLPRRESGGQGSNKFYRGRDTEDGGGNSLVTAAWRQTPHRGLTPSLKTQASKA